MHFTIRNESYMILRRRGFAMPRRIVQRAGHPIVNAGLGVPYERRLGLLVMYIMGRKLGRRPRPFRPTSAAPEI